MSCPTSTALTKDASLEELVSDFLERERSCPRGEIGLYRDKPIEVAIEMAARAIDRSGNLPSHQWHLRFHPEVGQQAVPILLKCVPEIEACRNFGSLYELIKSKLQIPFAGKLYWYDTAFRLGISMNLYPEKVYLHCGTEEGAKNLGVYNGKETLEMSELLEKVPELERLQPYQVEDFLCRMRDVLKRFKRPSSVALSEGKI